MKKIRLDFCIEEDVYSSEDMGWSNSTKGYHGFIKQLPAVHTCGDTVEETLLNIIDALQCYLSVVIEDNDREVLDKIVKTTKRKGDGK